MNRDIKIPKLSRNEAGKLRGGFSIQPAKIETNIWATNGNCMGGGWGDTNTNCTGTCSSCSVNQKPETSIENETVIP